MEISHANLISIKGYRESEQTLAQILTFEDAELFGQKHTLKILGIPNGEGFTIGVRMIKKE